MKFLHNWEARASERNLYWDLFFDSTKDSASIPGETAKALVSKHNSTVNTLQETIEKLQHQLNNPEKETVKEEPDMTDNERTRLENTILEYRDENRQLWRANAELRAGVSMGLGLLAQYLEQLKNEDPITPCAQHTMNLQSCLNRADTNLSGMAPLISAK